MHVAITVGTYVIGMFGGTHAQKVINPKDKDLGLMTIFEPYDRLFCSTACNLIECAMKERGLDKCINNIRVDDILDAISNVLHVDCIIPQKEITMGAYIIVRDAIKYGFPFEECIEAAGNVQGVTEVIVVDGGSKDGTHERLLELTASNDKLRIFQHPWDLDEPMLFGNEKTYARQQCTADWLIQLDADEIIHENHEGALLKTVQSLSMYEVLDTPVIDFYGDDETVRVEGQFWKWRITKRNPNVIHGVHGKARFVDKGGKISMDKSRSDGCEYVDATKDFNMMPHKPIFPMNILETHEKTKTDPSDENKVEYQKMLADLVARCPVVFHYSWRDLARKEGNGEFWDTTHHGKEKATHNTTDDIRKRVEETKDSLVKVSFDHPLKRTPSEKA